MSPHVSLCHHVSPCVTMSRNVDIASGSARLWIAKTLMPEMGQLQKHLLLCSMGEAPGRRERSRSKGMRAQQAILCSRLSRYPAGVQKYQPAFKHRTFEMLSKKLQTCLDRVDSQGWLGLGVVWLLAGLIELGLRHFGGFDFGKANMRLWIGKEGDCPYILQTR